MTSRGQEVAWADLRDGVGNAGCRFAKAREGRVVFVGGSITEMAGWRDQVCERLTASVPETTLDFLNAGMTSTDSRTGTLRTPRDGGLSLIYI